MKMIWKLSICSVLLLYLVQQVFCEETTLTDDYEHRNLSEALARSANNFGYKLLLTMMEENKDENVVISPVSVAGLLGITMLGTVGKTYEELTSVLGFSQDLLQNRKNHDTFGELLQSLYTNNENNSKTVYANSIFVDEHVKLRQIYRNYLSYAYKSEINSVNFTQAVEVKEQINEWVSKHTMDKIKNFLEMPLPSETRIVLLSALYFNGQWKQPFLPEFTMPMPFQNPLKEITVDQMINTGQFDYIFSEEYDMHMIALPYNDSITTMYVLKPMASSQSLSALLNRLDYDKIDQLITQMASSKCVIRFPKMDIQSNVKLEKAFKSLGIRSLFNPSEANFALMVNVNNNNTEDDLLRQNRDSRSHIRELVNSLPNPGIYVDSVLHDVRLTINEFGTEAVAASAGVLARTAKLFYANSPFYIFIRNEQTKLVTFSAAIFDPTASQK